MADSASAPVLTLSSASTTLAPSLAKSSAVARPMPAPAPVIMATLSASLIGNLPFFSVGGPASGDVVALPGGERSFARDKVVNQRRDLVDRPSASHRDAAHHVFHRLRRNGIKNLGPDYRRRNAINRNIPFAGNLFSQCLGERDHARFGAGVGN